MTASLLPKLAIFDLGNVIFSINWDPMYESWSRASGVPVPDLKSLGNCVEAINLFEINAIDGDSFRRAVNAHLSINLTPKQFQAGWCSIFLDANQQVCELLPPLSQKMKIVAFSNTNEIHAKVWLERYRAELAPFHAIYRSSQLGMRKPDAESFSHLLALEKVSPQETVFFDDSLENVESARRLGIQAVLVDRPERVGEYLSQLQLPER